MKLEVHAKESGRTKRERRGEVGAERNPGTITLLNDHAAKKMVCVNWQSSHEDCVSLW